MQKFSFNLKENNIWPIKIENWPNSALNFLYKRFDFIGENLTLCCFIKIKPFVFTTYYIWLYIFRIAKNMKYCKNRWKPIRPVKIQKKYNRSHYLNGQEVSGRCKVWFRNCFLISVPDKTEKTLILLIKNWFLSGTNIKSDRWAACKCLKKKKKRLYLRNH